MRVRVARGAIAGVWAAAMRVLLVEVWGPGVRWMCGWPMSEGQTCERRQHAGQKTSRVANTSFRMLAT